MREILFRGFHSDPNGRSQISLNGETVRGRWEYGSFFDHQPRMPCVIGENEQDLLAEMIPMIIKDGFADWNLPRNIEGVPVIRATVGEFTGRFDKNKKRIFEGDRVFGTFYGLPCEIRCESQISWSNEVCGLQMNYFDEEDIEVIGTVFDVDESRIS